LIINSNFKKMIDPIKEKLKQDRTTITIKDTIKENLRNKGNSLPVVSSKESNIRKLYKIADPIQVYGENPGLVQLEGSVKEINKGQKQLEKIKRMDNSILYKGLVHISDGAKELFGKSSVKIDIYELFAHQQQNVRALNYILTSMVNTYNKDADITKHTLDNLVMTTTKESLMKQNLDKEIHPEIQRYEDALEYLAEVDKDKQPEKYYDALQEVIDSKRVSRKKRFEYVITTMGQEHHGEQINNLMLQEELFETILYRITEMAFKTELYQQTLDNNARIWERGYNLFKAVSMVSGGISVMSDFNKELNDSYINAIGDIVNIVDSHPGRNLLNTTNRDLRQLVVDVNASSYKDTISNISE